MSKKRMNLKKQELLNEIYKYASWGEENGGAKLRKAKNQFRQQFPNAEEEDEALQAEHDGTRAYLLSQILWFASKQSEDAELELEKFTNQCRRQFPGSESEILQKVEDGHFLLECLKKARIAGQEGRETVLNALRESVRQRCGDKHPYMERLEEQYRGGEMANIRRQEIKRSSSSDTAAATNAKVQPRLLVASPFDTFMPEEEDKETRELPLALHANMLTNLKPSSSWTILFDETGSCFDWQVDCVPKSKRGKFVAVLVPEEEKLPDLPVGWHAANKHQQEIVDVVNCLLHSKCGVIGIPVESLPRAFCSELWSACFEDLLALILRLINLNGPTVLHLRVEERGSFTPDQSIRLMDKCNAVMYQLSRLFPERARWITIDPKIIIGKEDHPWNGYADAAAFVWGSSDQKPLLAQTQWQDTCLLGSSPQALRNTLDVLRKMQTLEPKDWNDWVQSPAVRNPNSMVGAMLKLVGEEAQQNPELWNMYLDYVQDHLYSKAIDLYALSRQVAWLDEYMPENHELTPRLKLVWLITKLATANHHGKTDTLSALRREFEELCDQLYFEDAPLVCQATLHVAVAFTDEFLFDQAARVMNYWDGVKMEVPGRQYYNQIISTWGQLAAFTNRNDEAVALFTRALEGFAALSDEKLAYNEALQTTSYLLIAMMDSPSVSAEKLEQAMQEKLGRTLECAIDFLAPSIEENVKYTHHVLLRYLVQYGSAELRACYLNHQAHWQHGKGHPWELIEFYRALLMDDLEEQQAQLRYASEIVRSHGSILKLISCVILGGLRYTDTSCHDELAKLTEECIQELPAIGEECAQILRKQLDEPLPPLELAKAVLPFNFH